jgi:hypothetical protein
MNLPAGAEQQRGGRRQNQWGAEHGGRPSVTFRDRSIESVAQPPGFLATWRRDDQDFMGLALLPG